MHENPNRYGKGDPEELTRWAEAETELLHYMELFAEGDLTYLKVKTQDRTIILERMLSQGTTSVQARSLNLSSALSLQKSVSRELVDSSPQTEIQKSEDRPTSFRKDLVEVRSPLTGTFYEAPYPGAEPFVKVGDNVKEGDVLCIVEAMKVMNEIESPVNGKILEILVKNGQPVGEGQVMFIIEPA